MKVLLTGATGYIGGHLGKRLVELGHEVVSLTRNKKQKVFFETKLIDLEDLSKEKGIEAVVHLAGASVADRRWSKEYKRELISSRVAFTHKILQALDYDSLQVFLQTSATGYYPSSGAQILTEAAKPGEGFLSKLCVDWESSTETLDYRKVYFRTGMVVGKGSPAMKKMIPLFKKRLGAVLGNGEQYMSWVHIEDLVNMFIKALDEHRYAGAYNAVAPEPITNTEFTKAMSDLVGKTALVPPAPVFALKLMYGEMSKILLDSHRVIPQGLLDEGFEFKFKDMKSALESLTD